MIIDCHTHYKNNSLNYKIISITPEEIKFITENDYFSIGLHPWNITNSWHESLSELIKSAQKNNCLAIGECGLDRAKKTDFALQKKVFTSQLDLAVKLNKPIIIHCVKAFDELLAIAKKSSFKTDWLLHGYKANEQITSQLLKFDKIYFSFGNALFFSQKTQNSFKKVPLSRIMFETDESGINIESVYFKAAELLKIKISELETIIENNIKRFYKLQLCKN